MGAVRLLSEADVHHLVTPLEAEDVVEHKSIGVAIEDIALAAHVYEKAAAQEIGTVVKM